MKYAWVAQNCQSHSVSRMCRLLCVSRSGYYDWRRRSPSQRAIANKKLLAQIQRIHEDSRQNYGALKCWKQLNREGVPCGRHRVARLRRQANIYALRHRRSIVTTQSRKNQWSTQDLVKRRFVATAPNKVWVTDVTHVSTRAGWLYVAVMIDLFSRKVVGWAMSTRNNGALVLDCLEMAIEHRQPEPGLIHHSDRGTVYTQRAYRHLMHRHGIRQSMGRVGDCWDNAVAESFFNNLKNELVHCMTLQSPGHARRAVFDYIEVFYNRQRIHQTLDYRTPQEIDTLGLAA